ncbi:hypothetical protein LTR62_006737 [Meristemomyces frigidus]|uniref:RNA helicase n=1 Tax=Meristemomyces frigidus TaxID=1508187 RepID=A0AAN7TVS9_9PEZI|nr:hypothetical protein LTR62_006737 [Meristemomyces frigidus]
MDVYARPYIPTVLQRINELPAQQIHSLPAKWIDYQSYVHSLAGAAFLTADPPPPEIPETVPAASAADLQPSSYHAVFRQALIEEAQALQRDCNEQSLYNIPIQRAPAQNSPRPVMYWLQVPGLREMSLNVEIGDIVQLRQLNFGLKGEVLEAPLLAYNQHGPVLVSLTDYVYLQHNAVIWGIHRQQERLILRVDDLLPHSSRFNVCFTVQQGRLGALYRAVANIHHAMPNQGWLQSMLFPTNDDGVLQRTLNKSTIDWELHDKLLNYEQIRAVDIALLGNYGRVPYIISGPPGTGKTKTMVELALQLLKQPNAHLLVCAPSDPAADTLTERLRQHLAPSELLRLNPPSRSFPEVPMTILPFCYVDEDMFSLPPLPQLMRYKIVVTACRDAEILLRARLSNSDLHALEHGLLSALHPRQTPTKLKLHWTGLLVDEAAQAIEPEACTPLSVVAPPSGHKVTEEGLPRVIMAGDQNQLGPRTASKNKTLQTSLFERLLARSLYANHPLARSKQNKGVMQPLTKEMLPILRAPFANLIRNYRSHPAILATPSALFYNDTLEPEAQNPSSLLSWTGWQGRKWPVLFSSHAGKDEIEQDGGGWYNRSEATLALTYAQSFLRAGLLQQKDICIMSPFRAQVNVLRNLARTAQFRMRDVNVGPLEAFQGLECQLVILCTTRTRGRFLEQDLAKGLGVIHEPRRFNVALTRAKDGMVVIGNPEVLGGDPCWRAFLGFCGRKGLWEGEMSGWGQSRGWDGERRVVSRLEKQMVVREEVGEGAELGVEDGVRALGVYDDEEQRVWRAGMEMEEALRESAGAGEGEDEADEDDDQDDEDDDEADEDDDDDDDREADEDDEGDGRVDKVARTL